MRRNHGILTVGKTREAAVWRYIALENACHAQLLAEAAGTPKLVPHEVAQLTATQVGRDEVSFSAFQPYFDWIARLQPDLFD